MKSWKRVDKNTGGSFYCRLSKTELFVILHRIFFFFFDSFASFHPSSSQSQIERNIPSTAFFLKADQFCSFVSLYFLSSLILFHFFIYSVLQSNLKITTYNQSRFDLLEYEKFKEQPSNSLCFTVPNYS